MSELSLVLPEVNKPDKTEDPKIVTAFTQIQTWANGNIGAVNVDSTLTSRLRLIGEAIGTVPAAFGAVGAVFPQSGGEVVAGSPTAFTASNMPWWTYLNASDFAVSGKTTTLTLKAQMATNSTGPASTFTFSLLPVTGYQGGEGKLEIQYGAAVAGSTVALVPASNNNYTGKVSFAFPAAGYYSFGVALSAPSAAKSFQILGVQLFVSNT